MTESVALGRGGLRVGRYEFGGAPLGGLFERVDDDQSAACLAQAWAAGMRYFDTAPHYGAGLSERRIGSFLATKERAEWVLSTKVGRLLEPVGEGAAPDDDFVGEPASTRVFDFSRDGIRRSLDASLQRLGVDRIDIVYLHDPDDHWEQAIDEGWPALAQWRADGVVTSIGAGMKQAAMLTRFVRETDIDVVLLAGQYTLLDQEGIIELLPACTERSTSVVLGGVFNSGVLANVSASSTFNYGPATAQIVDRARRLAEVCARFDVPLAAAALQFPLAHPAITTVVIGARSAAEVTQNARLAALSLPAEMWSALRAEGLLPEHVPTPAAVAVRHEPDATETDAVVEPLHPRVSGAK